MNYNELGSKGIVSNKTIKISLTIFAIGLITLFAIALNH